MKKIIRNVFRITSLVLIISILFPGINKDIAAENNSTIVWNNTSDITVTNESSYKRYSNNGIIFGYGSGDAWFSNQKLSIDKGGKFWLIAEGDRTISSITITAAETETITVKGLSSGWEQILPYQIRYTGAHLTAVSLSAEELVMQNVVKFEFVIEPSPYENHYHQIGSEAIKFTRWTDALAQEQYESENAKASNCLPLKAGYYFLTRNVELSNDNEPQGEVYLCLNGHTVSLSQSYPDKKTRIISGSHFYLLDEAENNGRFEIPTVMNGGSFTMLGGNIAVQNGIAVDISTSGGFFTMEGGTIINSYGGVHVVGSFSEFTMNGGSIIGDAIEISKGNGVVIRDGLFTMNGGTIKNNNNNQGGGVSIYGDGTFTMNGGSIENNVTTASGGGVDLIDGTFTMNGGSITGNQAENGGAVAIVNGAFTMNGGSITGNIASKNGDGVYFYDLPKLTDGAFNLSGSAVIKDNGSENVYLAGNRKINITGQLSNTSIGITKENPDDLNDFTNGYSASGNDQDPSTFFKSDDSKYDVVFSGSNQEATLLDKTAHTHDIEGVKYKFTEWTDELAASQNGSGKNAGNSLPKLAGKYYLSKDVVLPDTWKVPSTDGIYLCLNGHSITTSKSASVIWIEGEDSKLYLFDDEAGIGVIDSNLGGGRRMGVEVHGGVFTMYGGTIRNNLYGVFVNLGTFILNGGSVSENINTGVYVSSASTVFTMNGGSVTKNSSTGTGSGVTVKLATFNLNGGSITDNSFARDGDKSHSAGVYIEKGKFNLSGSPEISGNTAEGKERNVYLSYDSDYEVSDVINVSGKLSNSKKIGVTMANPGIFTSNYKAGGNSDDPGNYFYSEDSFYTVGFSDDGNEATMKDLLDHFHDIDGTETGFVAWTDTKARKQWGEGATANNSLPRFAGSYYLTKDVIIPDEESAGFVNGYWNVPATDGIYLCLAGKNIISTVEKQPVIVVGTGAKLYLFDDEGKGKITYTDYIPESSRRYGLHVKDGGEFTMYGGAVVDSETGIYVRQGTLTINGGEIAADRGIVATNADATININGGKITGTSQSFYLYKHGTLNIGAVKSDNDILISGSINEIESSQEGNSITLYDGYYDDAAIANNDKNVVSGKQFVSSGRSDIYKWTIGEKITYYNVKIADSEHGTAAADKDKEKAGETVTLTISPDTGYELDSLSVKDSAGNDVSVNNNTFTMPESDVTVIAAFRKMKFTIIFYDEDGKTELQRLENVEYGTTPVFTGKTPTKQGDPQYSYTFAGWAPDLTVATRNQNYTATYSSSVNKYEVTFVNYDNSELQKKEYEYGAMPNYTGETPVRPQTVSKKYTFSGWDKEITAVTGETTYKAQFDESDVLYSVVFYDEDKTTILETKEAKYNDSFAGIRPSTNPGKEETEQYSYSFDGWKNMQDDTLIADTTEIKEDLSCYASFISTVRKYKIKFVDYDGSVIKVDGSDEKEYDYGTAASAIHKPADPTRAGHTFIGWVPSIAKVTENATYKADYIPQAEKEYVVTWYYYDSNGNQLTKTETVAESQIPSITHPDTPETFTSDKYIHTFLGWNSRIDPASEPPKIEYSATYSQKPIQYVVKWLNYDNTLLGSVKANKGVLVKNLDRPTAVREADAQYTYEFKDQWNPEIKDGTVVDRDRTFTAVFTAITRKYKISFINEDGSLLGKYEVEYGTVPVYSGDTPTKASSAEYDYSFKGWDKEPAAVTGDAVYQATYTQTTRKYTITWKDGDGKILDEKQWEYGSEPSYGGTAPTKKQTAQYSYTFNGNWDPVVESVTKNQTYTAMFDETVNTYKVEFVNYNGKQLWSKTFRYGDTPVYEGPIPTKELPGSSYSYVFEGKWSPDLAPVTVEAKYEAVFKEVPKIFPVTFDMNGADSPPIADVTVVYDSFIPEPAAPSKKGYSFAGWYASDSNRSKWIFTTPVRGEVNLKAQWIEESYEDQVQGKPVSIAVNDLQGKTISNKYNDKPLLIVTNNGVIVIPAGIESVTVPLIPNSNSVSLNLLKRIRIIDNADQMYGIYLDVQKSDISASIIAEDRNKGYTEVENGGFTAQFKLLCPEKGNVKDYYYPGRVTISLDLQAMGIELADAPSGYIRTFLVAHNYSETGVEYLWLTISADRKTASFVVSDFSPFALVYKDAKRTAPPTPDYVIPKTGN